jgi:hypothetical protein
MFFATRRAATQQAAIGELGTIVSGFDYSTRQALYAAACSGTLRRRTWNGCALNRAGQVLGAVVDSSPGATAVFHLPPKSVAAFVETWDSLRGSDSKCTEILREVIVTAGLFPERPKTVAEASNAADVETPVLVGVG